MNTVFEALNAVSTSGPGPALIFDSPRKFYHPSVQAIVTGAPAVFVWTLECTLDGVNWSDFYSQSGGSANTFAEVGLIPPVLGLRAHLQSFTGGTSPTLTVLIGLISDGIAV